MTMRVYKYNIDSFDGIVSMQRGAVVLDAQLQNDELHIWAQVDDATAIIERRRFKVVGTGHELPDDVKAYVATFQQESFVGHVYEVSL